MARARRTPPVSVQTTAAEITSKATIKKRLIDFDTGSAALEEQHKHWLNSLLRPLMRLNAFTVKLHGFSSKQGNAQFNKKLSMSRMLAVRDYLQQVDDRTKSSTRLLEENGEAASAGNEKDDEGTAKWRAVEVHIFDANPPPDLPGQEVKPHIVPLPGGVRYTDWAIAVPGGANWALAGFNIIAVRNEATGEKRGFINPVAGAGPSVNIPLNTLIQLATNLSMKEVKYDKVKSGYPVTWAEVEKSTVEITSLTQGDSASTSYSFRSSIHHYGAGGTPFKSVEHIIEFESSSGTIGLGLFAGEGPLIRARTFDRL